MPLKVALQMDPIGAVNINADSTFRIALEAQARGHSLFFYTPDRLAFVEGRVMARGWPRSKSIWPDSTWSGCARIRPSTWATSPARICWT